MLINKHTREDTHIMKGEKALISPIIQKRAMNILPQMIKETEAAIIITKRDTTSKVIRDVISIASLIGELKDKIWLRRLSTDTLIREMDWKF